MEMNFILTKLKYEIYLVNIENYLIVEKSNCLSLSYYSAGLQPKDIITHANKEPVINTDSIYKVLEQSIGAINLQVLRKGRILHVRVNPEHV
jgi:C-terminal processing protease CtpA/Prc